MQTHTLTKGFFSIFLLCLLVSTAAAAGGSGTAGDPFRIETPAELQAMNNDLDAYYSLQNDIDLTGVTWTPVGSSTTPFIGSLEGNGYTISNLEMNVDAYSVKYIGLFGLISGNSYVANTTLDNFIFTLNQSRKASYNVGCLAGSVDLDYSTTSTIYNVDVINSYIVDTTPEISYDEMGGCLIGYVFARESNINIIFCDVNNCNINIERRSGGLIGYFIVVTRAVNPIADASGYITNCNVSNTIVTSATYGSGLVGFIECFSDINGAYTASLDIDTCIVYATDIISEYEGAGICGVIELGDADVSITNCYVDSSNITGEMDNAGGIFGRAEPDSNSIFTIDTCMVISTNLSTTGWPVGGIGGSVYNNDLPNEFIITNSFIGDCNITAHPDGSEWDLAAGVIGVYKGLESPTLENIYVQNNEINGYAAEEIITLLDYYSEESTLPLDTTNVFGVGNLLNGSYHADLGDQTYLAAVTDTGASYSITITPPDSAAYTISSGAFYTEADYTDIGETWTSHTGSYTYTLPKTSGSSTASAGYLAIYKDGYSDYIYWGLPLFSYPIIITELDVPAVINLGESPGISATAYNINTYQWQHSTNGVSWSNVDESWAPTTAGTHYLRLKTANDDFTAYSGTATIQVIPQKAIVTFEAVTPTSIALNGDVTFIGSITLIGSDTLTSYTWNFGDGTTDSSTLAPTHTYTSAGTYTVTLTVVTAAGTTISTRTNYITVSAQPEFVKFDNTTYTAGDTATVSWNLLNTNFADHEYTIRIFRLDKLGQAFDALTPVPISSPSGSDTFDTTTWSGNYSVYIYQDSYIFREPTDIATVISIHDLQLLITNSGVTWENYTLLTISDGISTIAEGNTSTGTYTFNLQTGTYTITATTDGKTPISTTIYLSSNDIITFDWVTGASKGTTTGAGSAYASTFITFRVLDAKYGLPISGVTITTQGVAATNPFEWFANLFGTAWGATILGTNQSGITDDSGAITFAMFSGVRYIINIDYPVLDDPITRTFTPSSLATEYPIYLDIADPDTPDVTTSVATAVTANISGQIIASYSDTSLTTTSIRMEIFEKGLDGNYTLLDQISAYGNASTHAFQLTNFQGKNVKIIITGQTGAFGTVERIYYHTFPGPAVTLGNLPASAYIWICLISAILLGGVATYISSYAAAFVIVFVEWIYWFFGWFFEIGAIPAATLLTVATVIAVAAYMASRR